MVSNGDAIEYFITSLSDRLVWCHLDLTHLRFPFPQKTIDFFSLFFLTIKMYQIVFIKLWHGYAIDWLKSSFTHPKAS